MSWCDRLASTPTIGFKLTNHFAPIDTLLTAFAPIFDGVPEGQTKHVTIDQSTTNFSTAFNLNDGFKYAATESLLSVSFNHRMHFRPQSGGPPTMEMLSKPLPFNRIDARSCGALNRRSTPDA